LVKPKLTRRIYNEQTKKITIHLTEKFGKKEVAKKTGIPENNIKKWKKESKTEKGIKVGKRGKRVMYPDLEIELKN